MSALGPTALFDKSFLQSLDVDQSVWFGHFFSALGCPVFLVETLANLAKEGSREPDGVVSSLAFKYPDANAGACNYHHVLGQGDLLGYRVPMNGRVPRSNGQYFDDGGKPGLRFERSAEDEAFDRWRNRRFDDVERNFAAQWRAGMNAIDLKSVPAMLKEGGFNPSTCRTHDAVAALARQTVAAKATAMQQLRFAVTYFAVPQQAQGRVYTRWRDTGSPALADFAPYAAHVVAVELFGHMAMAASIISSDRPSNRIDLAYLHYLPFCQLFVSNDKLHQASAPGFLRPDQQFIRGRDLKADLRAINQHFLALPVEVREQGLMAFASKPPAGSLVAQIWEKHGRATTGDHHENLVDRIPEEKKKALVEMIQAARNAKPIDRPAQLREDDRHTIIDVKNVNARKGSWWQLRKGIGDNQS